MARLSAGLLGRILGIVLLAILFEFAASTFLYERAQSLKMREDEAHRVGGHVAVAYRVLSSRPPKERHAIAGGLSSHGLTLRWLPGHHTPPPIAPSLEGMREQILAWEPSLRDAKLSLYLHSPGRNEMVKGSLQLPDGSMLIFQARDLSSPVSLTLNRILLALIPAVALVIIAALLVRRTLRPMSRLAEAAEVIGRGESRFVDPRGPGEVRRVIRAFNAMQERIHRMIADRTHALAAVGHDLRTPIARLQLRAEQISEPELREALQKDVSEMEGMLDSLLAYLRGEADPEPRRRIDAAVLVRTLLDEAADQGSDVAYAGLDHAEACVRPLALKRALSNLIDNALKYGGKARVSVGRSADALVIRVEDDGPGIAEERLEAALQPFVRVDPARGRNTGGLGLGLAIVKRVIEAEGGQFALANRKEGGLRAEIRLPE